MKLLNSRTKIAVIVLLAIGISCFFFSKEKLPQVINGTPEQAKLETKKTDTPPPKKGQRNSSLRDSKLIDGGVKNSKSSNQDSYHFWDPRKANAPMAYEMVNSLGVLTTRAAEEVRLSPEERQAVQSNFNEFLANAENDTSSRARLDSEKSDPSKGITVYNIPASPDRGKALLDQLYSSISKSIGEERALTLCKSFDPHQFLGGVGSNDIQIQFHTPGSALGAGRDMVKYTITDPSSGAITTTAVMNLDAFKERFGTAFIFE